MRRVLIMTAAALAMGATGAVAAPMHGARGFGHGASAGMTAGRQMGANAQMSANANVAKGNVMSNRLTARNNFAPAAPGPRHGPRYARGGHYRRGWYGGGWGGLYAYEPGYNSCYDYGNWPYYNGYYNNCYYDYYNAPGPGFSFGWGW